MSMHVICLEDRAFHALLDHVVDHVGEKLSKEKKWIATEEAMELLNITSKTTLQTLRNERKIRFSQPMKKVLVYDRDSIIEYLDEHAK